MFYRTIFEEYGGWRIVLSPRCARVSKQTDRFNIKPKYQGSIEELMKIEPATRLGLCVLITPGGPQRWG